jgi:hypothetical protein
MKNFDLAREAANAEDSDRNHIPMIDALFWNFNQTIAVS